ncbi:MAG: hypothetical protein HQM11_04065 [SAR324 cluster bacterium]|nr:hypothetical protein [SAR324 cluster bacterium]
MYRDKIVDNLTLHKGKLYLIDFGVADTFDPQRPPNPASYQKHREEKIQCSAPAVYHTIRITTK